MGVGMWSGAVWVDGQQAWFHAPSFRIQIQGYHFAFYSQREVAFRGV